MNRALVVIGSENGERAFGLTSGVRVAEALAKKGWNVEVEDVANHARVIDAMQSRNAFDVVVPVGFGIGIEDGTVYTLARMLGIPCAGPDAATGSITTRKDLFSSIVTGLYGPGSGVRVPEGVTVLRRHSPNDVSRLIAHLHRPLIVKPNFGGSSLDLHVVESYAHASMVASELSQREGQVLVQEMIAPAQEVSVTILDVTAGPRVMPIVELRRDLVMSYDEKFGLGARDRHIIPARLDSALHQKLKNVCLTLHESIGACGLTRYDALLAKDEIVILEANAIPGLLPSSIACDAAREDGLGFEDLAHLYAMSAFIERSTPRRSNENHPEICSNLSV